MLNAAVSGKDASLATGPSSFGNIDNPVRQHICTGTIQLTWYSPRLLRELAQSLTDKPGDLLYWRAARRARRAAVGEGAVPQPSGQRHSRVRPERVRPGSSVQDVARPPRPNRAHGECDGAGTPEREGARTPDHKLLSTGGPHSQGGPLEP